MKILLLIACLIACMHCANWAVIIAGSSGYENYRHQADTCHAYQTLINKGIPAANIINLAYDDIANNDQNPFPGTLFNKPSNSTGWNVYQGCKFDYTGAQVTTENYVRVLTGDAAGLKGIGTGRYLQSTANDNVFLYFADHGGPGILGFPSQFFYKKQFEQALETMHSKKMYKQLVYYMEACESGSMFTGFPSNLNIYAVTAADASQSSWGCYCPPDDYVNGQEINSCLGDTFSVNWLENTDAATTSKETLEQQWEAVKQLTTQSDVCQWGDKTFVSEVIGTFLGMKSSEDFLVLPMKDNAPETIVSQESQYLTRVNYLKRRMEKNPMDYMKKIEYQKEILMNNYFDNVFDTIAMMAGVPEAVQTRSYPPLTQDDCFIELFEEFQDKCLKLTEYAVQYTRVFIHMCEKKQGSNLKEIVTNVCGAF